MRIEYVKKKSHWPGIALGLVTAGVIAWLALWALLGSVGYGIVVILLLALAVALPLLLALIIVTVLMLRRPSPPDRAVLAWMWLPTACALLITPVALWLDEISDRQFDRRHPPIHEQHVNLTGQDLRLPIGRLSSSGSRNMLPADSPRIIDGAHYPPRGDGPGSHLQYYDGELLREGVSTILRRVGPLDEGENHYAPRFDDAALRRAGRSVDPGRLQSLDPYFHRGYIYHHYPDRVEVSPILGPLAGLSEIRLHGTDIPFIQFHAANLGPTHVVRIEVDGQAMPLPYNSVPPAREGCHHPYHALGLATTDASDIVTVRWQTLDRPGDWQEATVTLPSLPATAPHRARHRLASVLLYFDSNETVKAERFMLWDLPGDATGIQASGPPSDMAPPPCGSATARYNMEHVRRM